MQGAGLSETYRQTAPRGYGASANIQVQLPPEGLVYGLHEQALLPAAAALHHLQHVQAGAKGP